MKKLLFVLAAGMLFSSCGETSPDVEAATDFCGCFSATTETAGSAAESQSLADLLEAVEETSTTAIECMTDWKAKYDGKITDGFGPELKKQCPDAYDEAVKQGMF
ncbi:MAG: hypothetical protein ACI837_003030 [Crocinitomicaceae bacterium]|jgi:hypothetical protein